MSNKIEGERVSIIFDAFTMEIERLYKKQCEENSEPKPSRSAIIRAIYREYLQKRIVVKK